jgi:hypothetical protein
MLEILSNIYILPGIVVVCGLIMMNLYLRVMKQDEDSDRSAYFKCGISIYLTSLATLMLYQKVCPTSLMKHVGGGVTLEVPRPMLPDNFNVGKVPF